MKNRYLILCLCLCVIVLSGTVGCAPWVDQLDRDDPKNAKFFAEDTIYDANFSVETFETRIGGLKRGSEALPPELKDPVVREERYKLPEGSGKVEMAFIHLSDVQIRDERVKLFGKNLSRTLDNVIPSFEHGTDQEHYDYAAYLAVIETINAYINSLPADSARRPKFMIHTGDAVDAGVVEELYEFIYVSNQLSIPWFNVLGNHDVTVFGNFNNKKVYVNDPNLTFQTLHNTYNFINMHGGGDVADLNVNYSPEPHAETDYETRSRYHGFDFYSYVGDRSPPAGVEEESSSLYLCRDCPGYYSFKLAKKDGSYHFVIADDTAKAKNSQYILCVVLDTTTTKLGFAKGTVGKDQLKWLEELLKGNRRDLILAFGHHPLEHSAFMDDSYNEVVTLFHRYGVVAYFCGHTHAYDINFHKGKGGSSGFWEVITDSILEYPQEGSLVTIRNFGDGFGCIDVQNFGRRITSGRLKDESDWAYNDAEKNHKRDINEEDRNARLIFYHTNFAK